MKIDIKKSPYWDIYKSLWELLRTALEQEDELDPAELYEKCRTFYKGYEGTQQEGYVYRLVEATYLELVCPSSIQTSSPKKEPS